MGFTTVLFLFFVFPLAIAGYYITQLIGKKFPKTGDLLGRLFLIGGSLCFYAWALLDYAFYLAGAVCILWILGIMIEKSSSGIRKRIFTAAGVLALIILLGIFKYYNTGVEHLYVHLGIVVDSLNLWVPLGISFLTFSAITYLVDIKRGNATAGSLWDCLLYITFFPKVVSGPIIQWKDFQPQIRNRQCTADLFVYGLNRIMIGFGKKLILADTFGFVLTKIMDIMPEAVDVPTAWLAAVLYMLQIYYDFAGYSDIAIGLAACFGFQWAENFHFPYLSTSITEFWRSWHISLGSWFREYVYIPLGGNRKGLVRTLLNLAIVFMLTGVWHGATTNYLIWGSLHGAVIIIERCIRNRSFYKRIPSVIKWLVTMALVMFGWMLFYTSDMKLLGVWFGSMFGKMDISGLEYTWRHFLSARVGFLVLVAVLGGTLPGLLHLDTHLKAFGKTKAGFLVEEIALMILMFLAVMCMMNSTYSPFIYFQY